MNVRTLTRIGVRRRTRPTMTPFVTALLLMCALAEGAGAQTVRGVLLDARFERPIRGGSVYLVTDSQERIVTASVDAQGGFYVVLPGPGTYFIGSEALGYEAVLEGPLDFEADAFADIEIRLGRAPIALEGVTGAAARRVRSLEASGFYRRREEGSTGRFFTREDIERRAVSQVQQLLRTIPGITVEADMFGRGRILMTRSRGFNLRSEPCFPAIYIDGIPQYGGGIDGGVVDQVRPHQIEAMEVYGGVGSLPAEYAGVGAACGVILIWTRR